MTTRIISSTAVIYIVLVCSLQAFAQTSDRRQANSTLQAQEQPTTLAANMNSIDAMTNEIDLLRKSLQTLNTAARHQRQAGRSGFKAGRWAERQTKNHRGQPEYIDP